MQSVIDSIRNRIAFLADENFISAGHGTKHHVFISQSYILRVRKERHSQETLVREAEFLRKIAKPLVPRVLWQGVVGSEYVVIENRLPGERLSKIWHDLSVVGQRIIISDLIDFLRSLRRVENDKIYSVKSGKHYQRFYDYLVDKVDCRAGIDKFPLALELKERLEKKILSSMAKNIFDHPGISLVHGDLLIHNLITDGTRLSGVVDWETAMFGDPDFDICRLIYYQELARSYYDRGRDEIFECDFIGSLLLAVGKSELIADLAELEAKYDIIRSVFYLDALYWAVGSSHPLKYMAELREKIDKNYPFTLGLKCTAKKS